MVTRVWGSDWNDQVAVLIPDTAQEFAAVTGDGADTADLAAVAVADQVRGDGTVLGARIVLNPANLARLDATGRRLVIGHELTHIASRAATSDRMPTWLVEGLADYVGNLGSNLPVPAIAAELATEVRAGKVPAALPSDADFAGQHRGQSLRDRDRREARPHLGDRTGRNRLLELEINDLAPKLVDGFPTVRQPNSVAVDERTGAVVVVGRDDGDVQIIDPEANANEPPRKAR